MDGQTYKLILYTYSGHKKDNEKDIGTGNPTKKFKPFILNNSREIHVSLLPFLTVIWNYGVALLLTNLFEELIYYYLDLTPDYHVL